MNISVNLSSEIKAAKEKKVLNKPFRTSKGPKKFSVYVKNEKGNIVKVNFGDPNMEIKRDDPARRKSFRARHQCDTKPGPRWKARYWSCKMWESKKSVTDYTTKGSIEDVIHQWDGMTYWNEEDLLKLLPSLAQVEQINDPEDPSEEAQDDITEYYPEEAAEMALAQLKYISENSTDLLNKLSNNLEMQKMIGEPWIQSKLTLMEDYLFSVYNYLMGDDSLIVSASESYKIGQRVLNTKTDSLHFASEGSIIKIEDLPNNMGQVITYEVNNEGKNFKKGDLLTKTPDQLQLIEGQIKK